MKKLSKDGLKLRDSIVKEYSIDDDAGLAILDVALQARDLMNEAQQVVDKEGMVVKGDRGNIKAHPLLATIRDSRAQFLSGLKHLNLDISPMNERPGRPNGR